MHSAGAIPAEGTRARAFGACVFSLLSPGEDLGARSGRMTLAEQTARTRKVSLQLSAPAERYARRDAPLEAREMAARGALALEPIELSLIHI